MTLRTLPSLSLSIVALLLVGGTGAAGCAGTSRERSSTHHSLIRVKAPEVTPGAASQPVDFKALHEVVDTWAMRSGISPVPPARAGQMRLSWSTSNPDGDEQVLRYAETRPADAAWPIELLVAYDPDGPRWAELSMGEGFGKSPSPRLRELYDSLAADLRARFGDRVEAQIW